jgi:DNA-binding MarR family transcriptional regulator
VSRFCARLARAERDGFVQLALAADGRKTVLVKLTAQGHALIEQSVDAVLGREATLTSGLSERERTALIALLDKLMADVRRRTAS